MTGKAICHRCIHAMNMAGEGAHIPQGAIQCGKCRSFVGVVCTYPQGDQAVFRYMGLSKDNQAIYTLTTTTAAWKQGRTPSRVHCAKCSAHVPYWMLEMNRYARAAHTA